MGTMLSPKREAWRTGCIFFLLALGMAGMGCAHLKEAGRCLWGSSIAHLEKARADAQVLDVTLGRDAAFEKVEKILTDSGAQVYLKDRDKVYLAAMGFVGHVDTTQVGVFFEPGTERATRIEVASMSPSLVDRVSALLAEKLGEQVSRAGKKGTQPGTLSLNAGRTDKSDR